MNVVNPFNLTGFDVTTDVHDKKENKEIEQFYIMLRMLCSEVDGVNLPRIARIQIDLFAHLDLVTLDPSKSQSFLNPSHDLDIIQIRTIGDSLGELIAGNAGGFDDTFGQAEVSVELGPVDPGSASVGVRSAVSCQAGKRGTIQVGVGIDKLDEGGSSQHGVVCG